MTHDLLKGRENIEEENHNQKKKGLWASEKAIPCI
jgi:hypothetical protein